MNSAPANARTMAVIFLVNRFSWIATRYIGARCSPTRVNNQSNRSLGGYTQWEHKAQVAASRGTSYSPRSRTWSFSLLQRMYDHLSLFFLSLRLNKSAWPPTNLVAIKITPAHGLKLYSSVKYSRKNRVMIIQE